LVGCGSRRFGRTESSAALVLGHGRDEFPLVRVFSSTAAA
jgi:hypothetical protein